MSQQNKDQSSINPATVSFRKRIFQILEIEHHGLARLINSILMFFIAFTLVIVFVETEQEVFAHHSTLFLWFEYLSIGVFTLEYITRIWSSAEINPDSPWKSRWHYILSPLAIIDLLAILPFFLGLFLQMDTRYLRAVRLLRVLKFTRYSRSLTTLLQVIKNELPGIISALSILLVMIILASSIMYLVERDAQPENFGSIPQAIWWATITLTTVGYGDVVPITTIGKILGIIITILGVGVAALPAGILASGFTSEMQNRKDEFRARIMTLLSDKGTLSHEDLHEIERLRQQLGLNMKEGKSLIRLSGTGKLTSAAFKYCPHCGESLTHRRPD